MQTAIATVCLPGTLNEKLQAIAAARFMGVEIFENDLLSFDGTPAELARKIRELGLDAVTFQPFRDFEGMPELQTVSIGMLGLATAAILLITLPSRAHHPAQEGQQQTPRRPPLAEAVRRRGFAALSAVGMLDSATRTGLLTFLPFVLARKGADTAVVGTALSLVFAGGAVGKFACGALATRVGILRTVAATELGTALAILALLVMPLSVYLLLMPVLGIMLNGTSSVLYGTVAELTPNGREARAFGFFYTVTIGADAIAPTLYGRVADGVGLSGTILLVATVVLLILPLLAVLRPTIEEHRRSSTS